MNLRAILRRLTLDEIKRAVRYGILERRREALQGKLDAVLKEMAALEGNGTASKPGRRGMRKANKLNPPTQASK